MLGKIKKFDLLFLLIFALILRLFFSYFVFTYQHDRLIQDDYPSYADALLAGNLNTPTFVDFDKRLFPTYPILIVITKPLFTTSLYAGIALSILSSIVAIYLSFKLFKDKLLVLLMVISPPVWIEQSAKVANEPFFIVLALSALMLFFKKRYLFTGFIMGLAFTTRPVALMLIVSLLIFLLQKKQFMQAGKTLIGFILPVLLLVLFNYFVFGPHELLQQFSHPDRYGHLRFGFIQISQDFYRTLDWKQYKIFISGTFYVGTNLFALVILLLNRKKSDLIYICFLWISTTLLFILTFSPFTLLDDFGRYALASLPAYLLGFSLFYKTVWKNFTSKNKLSIKAGK